MSCISVNIRCVPTNFRVETKRIYTNFSASIARVCDLKSKPYIIVGPEEPQWIFEHQDLYYDVKSNTNWTVK